MKTTDLIFWALAGTAAAVGAVAAHIYYHPQIIVGAIQKALYKGAPINSFKPFHEPMTAEKEDGSWYVSEVKYGEKYPNSYLDITYPNRDTLAKRPTVVYFHGGGYFGGDKAMGDPLAAENDANRLFREVVAAGYNFVNINYALVPEYHFPVPLEQTVEALEFLKTHADDYGLDMTNVVIFGQSAGAILAAEYGALLSNEEYREKMNLFPTLQNGEIRALIIDDAPLVFRNFDLKLKLLMGNYFNTMRFNAALESRYSPVGYINSGYPPSFMTAGNTDGFPEDMQILADNLTKSGVENEYYRICRKECELPHGYLGLIDKNKYARECFDRILSFIKKYTGGNDNGRI